MSERTKKYVLSCTKNYRLFTRSEDNRPVDARKHRRLERSLKKYGFLPCYPLACYRDEKNRLIVLDGQHRLLLAETLGLAVYWVDLETSFDIAEINCSQEKWNLRDYARKYAANGIKAYVEGLEFAGQYGLTLSTAFALLAGTAHFHNVQAAFETGQFQVRDRKWAESVAFLYSRLTALSKSITKKTFVEACMAVTRVESFDQHRLVQNADRCREKLVSYSTREAFLEMLEEIYNFGRKQLVPLKVQATMAMRDRAAVKKKPQTASL
jgi:hypothetical protein